MAKVEEVKIITIGLCFTFIMSSAFSFVSAGNGVVMPSLPDNTLPNVNILNENVFIFNITPED